MLPNFIAKTTIEARQCLRLPGAIALESYQSLRDALIGSVGRDAASLFAEPILTPKGDRLEVAWYTEQIGEPVAIDALDTEAHRIVADKLRSRLALLEPLLGGSFGALLCRALYVADRSDILAIGQEPVLIRWGMLAEGSDLTEAGWPDRQFAATLGPYARFGAPRLTDRPRLVPSAAPPPQQPLEPSPAFAARPAYGAALASQRGLLIATACAAAAAILLALPGVSSRKALGDGPGQPADLALARQISVGMKDKLDKARAALAVAHCNQDGTFGSLPTNGDEAQLPPSPVPIRPDPAGGGLALVARRATESVVFIVTCTGKEEWDTAHKADKAASDPLPCPGQGLLTPRSGATSEGRAPDLVFSAAGSGFFIGPNLIATNTHVVEGAKAVFVTSRFLGRLLKASVAAATVKQRVDDPDFAAVTIEADRSPPPIALTSTVARLQNVVAAGYPGVILQEDTQLRRLFNGDLGAAPELTTFPGFVTVTMATNAPLPLIYSSAVIGHGNSGGPLLDLCARAVGVNTLGWSGDEGDSGYKINVAEGAKGLTAFLDQHHLAYQKSDEGCQPEVAASDAPKPPTAFPGPTPAASSQGGSAP